MIWLQFSDVYTTFFTALGLAVVCLRAGLVAMMLARLVPPQ